MLLTTAGCVSKPVKEKPALPPKPERIELEEPQDLKDIAYILNYYETLVEAWEAWGETVEALYEIK